MLGLEMGLISNPHRWYNDIPPKRFKGNQSLEGAYCIPKMSDFLSYANHFEINFDNNDKKIYRIGFMFRAIPMKISQSKITLMIQES